MTTARQLPNLFNLVVHAYATCDRSFIRHSTTLLAKSRPIRVRSMIPWFCQLVYIICENLIRLVFLQPLEDGRSSSEADSEWRGLDV